MTLRRRFLLAAAASFAPCLSAAQHDQADFPPEEFRARWTGAYLLLDGRSRRAILYLPPRNERLGAGSGRAIPYHSKKEGNEE